MIHTPGPWNRPSAMSARSFALSKPPSAPPRGSDMAIYCAKCGSKVHITGPCKACKKAAKGEK